MNEYTITFEKAALKFIRKQDKMTQKRLLTAISQLPMGTDIARRKGGLFLRGRIEKLPLDNPPSFVYDRNN